jgi:hypothetical protein
MVEEEVSLFMQQLAEPNPKDSIPLWIKHD